MRRSFAVTMNTLAARAISGDRAAWGEIYERMKAQLQRSCARMLERLDPESDCPVADPDELVHEAFLRVLEFQGTYQSATCLPAYIAKTLFWVTRGMIRQLQRLTLLGAADEIILDRD